MWLIVSCNQRLDQSCPWVYFHRFSPAQPTK